MAKLVNKNKELDPSVLDVLEETPPDINQPIVPEPEDGIPADEILPDPENEEPAPEPTPELEPEPEPMPSPAPEPEPVATETEEDKEKKYRSQQSESQIQRAKSEALISKVDEAASITEPTEAELRAYVNEKGSNWDELTNFEQLMAKDAYVSRKQFNLVHEAVQGQKQIDEWAGKVDDFIDLTDGKPEYIELSSHESEFRSFCMKESHRGTPIDILLGAFLHNLPATPKSRVSLFERGGGGDKVEHKDGIEDADTAAKLRRDNPREYARQLKAGKIKIQI